MSTEMPDAQECKKRSIKALAKFEDIPNGAQGSHLALALLAQVAQVWATLATVPEPLEELTNTVELAAGDRIPELPNLVCPHGFVARLSSNVAHPGERPRLKYSFTDCETCP